jgi:hypothetical protein
LLSLVILEVVAFALLILFVLDIVVDLLVIAVVVFVHHLILTASSAFASSAPNVAALFVAADFNIGFHLFVVLLDFEFRDFEGLAAGEVALELCVVLLFEVEADIDGDSARHINIAIICRLIYALVL